MAIFLVLTGLLTGMDSFHFTLVLQNPMIRRHESQQKDTCITISYDSTIYRKVKSNLPSQLILDDWESVKEQPTVKGQSLVSRQVIEIFLYLFGTKVVRIRGDKARQCCSGVG